ncbi:DNA-damage-inducible protein J [Spirochaetia bacterium]|nr:DNA-damage-inducible protein J [Spirochaetia bacterium]
MAQTNINIRMDEGLKKQAESLFNELGMNMTTAFNIFVRQSVRQRKIPFEVSADAGPADSDPFYSESNMKVLRESIKQANEGKFIVKTMEELEAMAK